MYCICCNTLELLFAWPNVKPTCNWNHCCLRTSLQWALTSTTHSGRACVCKLLRMGLRDSHVVMHGALFSD